MGCYFKIYTYFKPLMKLFDYKHAISATDAARIQRCSLYLSNFDYQVEYRKNCDNSNLEALTCLPLASTEFTFKELSNVQLVQVFLF